MSTVRFTIDADHQSGATRLAKREVLQELDTMTLEQLVRKMNQDLQADELQKIVNHLQKMIDECDDATYRWITPSTKSKPRTASCRRS